MLRGFHDKLFPSEEAWTTGRKLLFAAILGSPLWLTIILSAIGDIDARRTRERLDAKPQTTWREILTPEERERYGLDRIPSEIRKFTPLPDAREWFRGAVKEGSWEHELIEKLDQGDYKDYFDYYDGAEGNIGDVDFDDISDYFGGGND